MGMRPTARMPKLTRRSRILILIALGVIALLLAGPRLVDAYVDWLWFGELGYRSVFTTVLVTRIVVFLVAGLLVGGIVFGGLALAYRTRPVFVPSNDNDPVARYRAVVMSRLRTAGHRDPGGDRPAGRRRRAELLGSHPAVLARRRLRDQGSAVRQGPRLLRVRAAFLSAGAQLRVRRGLPGFRGERGGALYLWRHPAVRPHRRAEPLGAYSAGQPGRHRWCCSRPSPTGWTAMSCCRTRAAASRSPVPATPTSTPCCRPS